MEKNRNIEEQKIQPVHIVRRGGIAASIWQRSNNSGRYYDLSLSRSWKSEATQKQGYSNCFFAHNASALTDVIEEACDWINRQSDAGIPYQTEEGIADFHAAGRHTYITQLIRSGVSLPTAMELARHSDVKMTMRYTHIGIADQAAALASLPAAPQPVSLDSALHGRCISGGGGCHNGAQSDIEVSATKKEKRRKSLSVGTYGVQSQGLSETLKVEAAGIE